MLLILGETQVDAQPSADYLSVNCLPYSIRLQLSQRVV